MTDPMPSQTIAQSALPCFLSEFAREARQTPVALDDEGIIVAATRALAQVGAPSGVLDGIAALLQYAVAEVDPSSSVLDEENRALDTTRQAITPIQQARLQARVDRVEALCSGEAVCPRPGCGHKAHSHGRRTRVLLGRHGQMQVSLRRLVCQNPDCRHGFFAAAETLGLQGNRFTAGCAAVITMACTELPYGKALELLGALTGIELSEHAAQELTMSRGREVVAADEAAASRHAPYDDKGLRRVSGRPDGAVQAKDAPRVAYLEVDGVLPMTREELPDSSEPVAGARGGKGRRYKLEGKEVKNAVLYRQQDHAQEMPSRGCLLQRWYVSHLGHWGLFAMLVWLAMLRLRFDKAELLVVLGDGAGWIASLVEWLPMHGRVLHILDYFHACHRAWEVARAVFGHDSEQAGTKARWWCEVIKDGGVDLVIRELRQLGDDNLDAGAKTKVEELTTYFENSQKRMDYPTYLARGLRISSGIVESANYHVTGARLKQQGMRWSPIGAKRLAALRADLCNRTWDKRSQDLLAARAARLAA